MVSNQQPRWVVSGGIGSGKTMVRQMLRNRGFATIDADSVGHEVLKCDGPAFDEVAAQWPEAVEKGEIDRSTLGRIVFSDPDQLKMLERLTHPHIFGIITRRVEGIEDSVVVEIPLLEHSLEGRWRRIIIDCADDIRLSRLLTKGVEESDARVRMAAQPSRAQWLTTADVVVPNHESLSQLESTVDRLTPFLTRT